MTDGEKMIWAAAFAEEYRNLIREPPSRVTMPLATEREAWEVDQAVSAAETACYTVRRARELGTRLSDGFGPEHDVTKMLAEMLSSPAPASSPAP